MLDDDDIGDSELTEDEGWLAGLNEQARPSVEAEWHGYLRSHKQPDDRQRWAARKLIKDLFFALHSNALFGVKDQNEKRPKGYWCRQRFALLQVRDETRGFDIDKGALSQVAAEYLSKPEIRTDRLDWIFLDAIVFQELDAFAEHVISTRGGTGVNWAATFAGDSELKYYGLSLLFWVIGVAVGYVVPLALCYYLFTHDHELAGGTVLGIWALLLVWRIATYPFRWRARRRATKLLTHLIELYNQLGGNTINPRRWKQLLEAAAADGVVLDGAVFTIIDRAIARDPAAFLPHQSA
jgi:hypothetical protein